MKKFWKKIAATVMAAVIALSVLPTTTVFAASGDVGTISFAYTYDSAGNTMRYIPAQSSTVIRLAEPVIPNIECM